MNNTFLMILTVNFMHKIFSPVFISSALILMISKLALGQMSLNNERHKVILFTDIDITPICYMQKEDGTIIDLSNICKRKIDTTSNLLPSKKIISEEEIGRPVNLESKNFPDFSQGD